MSDKSSELGGMSNEEFVQEIARRVFENAVVTAERMGQKQTATVGAPRGFEVDDTLPRGTDHVAATMEQQLKKMGVVFLEVVEDQPLLWHVQLPTDWRKVATDDPRYFWLVDEAGRERASLFVSLKPYDQETEIRHVF